MKMPKYQPAKPRAQDKACSDADNQREGVAQAGCCLLGCHCVTKAPFC